MRAPDSPIDVVAIQAEILNGRMFEPLDVGQGDLSALRTTMDGRGLLLLGFNYQINQGSIGIHEADQLVAAIRYCRNNNLAVVFLFETSGIRVTDGTAGIASLRKVLREAEDARLDGVRMLAIIGKCAFGGASILSAICERRIVHAESLFSVSGPKLIEQSVGADVFNARNQNTVLGLLSGRARAQVSDAFQLVEPTPEAYHAAFVEWWRSPAPPPMTLDRLYLAGLSLSARLAAPLSSRAAVDPQSPMLPSNVSAAIGIVLAAGYELQQRENVVIATDRRVPESRTFALLTHDGAGARDVLALTRELIGGARRSERFKRCVVLLDAQSHKATPGDEAIVFSEALAILSLAVRALHRRGELVDLIIVRAGGGGIQAALGSGASSVTMNAGARLHVLPAAALRALNKSEDIDAGSLEVAVRCGAVDGPHHLPTTPAASKQAI